MTAVDKVRQVNEEKVLADISDKGYVTLTY